jgi:hypothetical protein
MGILEDVSLLKGTRYALEPQTSLPDLHTTEFEYKKKAQEAVALESQGIIVPAGVAKPRMVNGLHV